MADMRPWTRQDVIDRANDTLDWFGYYYGGECMYNIQYVSLVNGTPTLGTGSLIAADCSAFASWCYNRPNRINTTGFYDIYPIREMLPLAQRNGDASHDAPGIQEGDCFLNPGHHIAIYLGNNMTIEMHTSTWSNSTNGQGGSIRRWNSYGSYICYVPFDDTYSEDYDPDDPEYNPSDGSPPLPPPSDDSDDNIAYLLYTYGIWYTKRYINMKHWRM